MGVVRLSDQAVQCLRAHLASAAPMTTGQAIAQAAGVIAVCALLALIILALFQGRRR